MFPVWWAHCGHQFGVTICRPPIDKLKDYLPGFTLVIMSLARSAQERLVGWKTIKEGSRVIGEQRIRVPVFEPVPWSSNSNFQHFSFLCPQNICPITSNHRRIDINQHCFRCFFHWIMQQKIHECPWSYPLFHSGCRRNTLPLCSWKAKAACATATWSSVEWNKKDKWMG